MAERGGGFDRPSDRLSGLWALILVARHHGIHATLDQLRRDNLVEGGSLDLGAIARCASGIGLAARVLPLRWDELRQAGKALPVILELRNGSFFLLAAVQETPDCAVAHLVDCAGGGEIPLLLDRTELEKVWAGRALLLKRNYELGDEQQPFGMGLVASFIFRDRRTVVDVAVCAAMLSVLALAPIMFWRLMTDRVLQYHAFSTFWVLSVFMAVFIAFETAFSAARRSFLVTLTTKIDVKLSTYMFAKVLALPVDYFERVPTGYTLHQMGMIGRIRSFLLGQLFGTVLDGGILLIFVPVMVFFSPLLTAIVLGLCSAIVAVIVAALPALRRRGGDVEAAEAARSGMLAQTIQGMRTVKSLALDRRQRHEWDVLTARVARARIAEGRLSNLVQSVVLPIERLVVSGSLAVGVYVALQSPDPATIGTLFAFLMLSQRIASPLVQAAQLLQQFDEARIATAVVADLVNRPPEEGRDGRGVRQPILGHVAFQDVLFTYRGAPRPALRGLSFEVPRGTSLGVMGRSGSGKTTITRLLQRLHSDYSGLIKIDGVDVRQYDVDFLRSSLGVVLQENFLFSGTIRDNIAMAKPDAGYDEVVTAARMAGAEEFIDKLPAGYETHVYEGSPNLSGGQRQRLAIARALITDPRILILDEATSALDAESEAVVNANIDRIARGRTVITISHRLASLVKCDAIMVLDGGAIDDIGRHEELLERNDIYAHLWFTQNQHASAPGAGDGPGRARRAQPRLAYRGPG